MIKERLESEGIRAAVINENSLLLGVSPAIASMHPQVVFDDADYERVMTWLSQQDEAANGKTVCPECGSENVGSVLDKHPLKRIGIALWLCVAALNCLSPGHVRKHQLCRDCGAEFR